MKPKTPQQLRRMTRYLDRWLVFVLIALTTAAQAQTVSQYTFGQAIGSFTPITGGTQLDVTTFDDEVYTVTGLPAFPFAGTYYTTIHVSANAFITFGSAPSGTNYTPISSTATYAGAISAFGVDVGDAGSGTREVRWQQVGNEIVVQWLRARRFTQAGETLDIQIRLNTMTGAINIVYTNSIPSAYTLGYPQVGLRGPNNTFATNVNNRRVDQTAPAAGSSWATSLAGTVNTDVCRYNNSAPGRNMANGQTYTWTPPCLPPTTSNAGPDQTICAGGTHVLAANAPSIGTGSWTAIAGPNTSLSQLSSTSSPTAVFTPTTSGTYTLTWSIANGVCTTSTDQVVITVNAPAATANAGPDNTFCPSGGLLAANSASPGTGAWTALPGSPSTLSSQFSSPASPTATFIPAGGPGIYTLRWTTSRTGCSSTQDDVGITVDPPPTTANAGTDQTMCAAGTQIMSANVPGIGTGSWTAIAGPNTDLAQLSSTTDAAATFAPTTTGTYTLTWTTALAACTSSDQVTITVNAPAATANAGPDNTLCVTGGALAANSASPGTGAWTALPSSPSTLPTQFSSTTSPTATFTAAGGAGTYTLRWTTSRAGCSSTQDDVTITVDPSPTAANAGTDQSFCLSSGSTTLAAVSPIVGTGSWTAIAGPSANLSQIVPTSANNATFTPPTSGTYTLTWTTSNGVCATNSDNVIYTVQPFAPAPITQTFNANGSYTVPAGVTQIIVQAWGGGAAGGGTANTGLGGRGGAGGGGGAYVSKTLTVTPGSTLSVLVAAQVAGSSGANGSNGNPSTITGFTSQVFAAGGSGGPANTSGNSPTGGAGGTVAASQGDSEMPGASGGNGGTNSGAGGAGANAGGAGGAAVTSGSSSGNGGTAPGGGGSGGRATFFAGSQSGGAGAAGRVIITPITPVPALTATATTICQGSSTTLTASGGASYLWSPGGATTASITVSPGSTTTYTVTITNLCPAVLTQQITVQPTPIAGANNTLTICSIDAAVNMGTLLGAHDAGSWTGPNTVTGDLYDPATMGPGNYVYTVTAAPCPNATATIAVTENTATPRYFDFDGDGFGDPSNSVLSCSPIAGRVSNNSDCNDAELQYADTDGDGFGAGSPVACGVVTNNTDNCPTVVGLIGSNCDALAGPGFALGQLNNSCQCIQIPCTQTVVLELRTDANSEEAGWEILDQNTNLVICSGGAPADPFPHGITSPITPECCLPVGCYRLRVSDGSGDGFVSGGVTGGYQLREQGMNGRRIIDNFGNFTTGHTSACANTIDNGAFCVPVGNDRPIFSSCDKLDWVNNQFIVATENTDVSAEWDVTLPIAQPTNSGYEFWFFDPNGSYSYRRFRNHATSDGFGTGATRACHMKVNGWSNTVLAPHIPANKLLNVRIRGRVNGSNQPFGPACLFKVDVARAACPIVKLQDNPLNIPDFSCGVVKVFGGANSSANRITANPPQFSPAAVAGQVRYQFRFRIPGENICIVRPSQTSPTLHMNWSGSGQLECSKSYEVDVRVSKDGGATWCVADGEPTCGVNLTPWGKVCAVTISTSTFCPGDLVGGSSNLALESTGELTMYPNPNHGEQVFINLSAVERDVNTISVDIYDLTGKRVIAKTVAVSDGMVNSALDLNGDLTSGVYMVNITAGTKTYTQRLVIQK